jgi:hypothetical protein
MSVDQYQRSVNSLDKEIADLEKKKANADKKAAEEDKKAASVNISKNASASTIKSKMNEIARHKDAANKARTDSASIGKKIADKRKRRNEAYARLQKAEDDEAKKQLRATKRMQAAYESRIEELEAQTTSMGISHSDNSEEVDEHTEYDVFVSHAWEDKESFVDEFVQALRDRNLRVWYDTSKMKWGDSMRAKIDEGLRHSKFGIAVLSPDYISDGKYWTKTELDGLFQLESINGKMLLPIWHKLTKKEVMDFSPIIAGKLAMNTASMTPEEIADKMAELLEETDRKEEK